MFHIWECREDEETARSADEEVTGIVIDWLHDEKQFEGTASELLEILHDALPCELRPNILSRWLNKHKGMLKANGVSYTLRRTRDSRTIRLSCDGNDANDDCALPGFVDSKNEEKTERNAGYLVVSHSGGGMLRQGTRKGIRRTPANRGMRAHRIVKSLDISEDVCHGLCP